ncbi:carbohydrate ABC transporter permease [Nonomuraea antimicrobica]
MTSPIPPQPYSRALGFLLAVPALLGALITLVLPTGQTIWLSFQSGGILRDSAYAGTANYAHLLGEAEFWRALGFTFSMIVFPLLVAVVVGPLLALALDRAGTWTRRAGRVVLSLAVVTFSPVAVAGAWMRGLTEDATGLATLADGLREPATAPGALRLIVAAATFGLVCALAVIAFLPALRGGTPCPRCSSSASSSCSRWSPSASSRSPSAWRSLGAALSASQRRSRASSTTRPSERPNSALVRPSRSLRG